VDYPVLTDVPVFILSGGGFAVTFPVAAGDTCLVCFNDRDLDSWFQSNSAVPPNSARMHSLSDGLALVGFRSLANPVTTFSTTEAALRNSAGNAKLAVTNAGAVAGRAVGGATFDLAASVDAKGTASGT
jgi:hypothetical protein